MYNTHKVAVTMVKSEHTKVRFTIKTLPATEPRESVIDVQRQYWSPLVAVVAQEVGDRHAYNLFES